MTTSHFLSRHRGPQRSRKAHRKRQELLPQGKSFETHVILGRMSDPVVDLLSFIDRSPTPYHAVAESISRLRAAGYRAIREDEVWDLAPGDRRYTVRHEGSLVAFQIGEISPPREAFGSSVRIRTRPICESSQPPTSTRKAIASSASNPTGARCSTPGSTGTSRSPGG